MNQYTEKLAFNLGLCRGTLISISIFLKSEYKTLKDEESKKLYQEKLALIQEVLEKTR